jgi:hypothetical protein
MEQKILYRSELDWVIVKTREGKNRVGYRTIIYITNEISDEKLQEFLERHPEIEAKDI